MCDQQYRPTQSTDQASAPALDLGHFDATATLSRFEGNKLLVLQLVKIFLNDAPRLVCQLKFAVAREQTSDALRHIHHLKTLVGNFGDSISVAFAEKLEKQLQCGVYLQPESELVQALERSIGELQVELSSTNEMLSGASEPPSGG